MKTLPKHEEQTRTTYENEHVLNGRITPDTSEQLFFQHISFYYIRRDLISSLKEENIIPICIIMFDPSVSVH